MATRWQSASGLIDDVAEMLGNTRSVCRRCYVHPVVLDSYAAGELAGRMAEVRTSRRGLTTMENGVLGLLLDERVRVRKR